MPVGKMDLDLPAAKLLPIRRGPIAPALTDVSAAVSHALEHALDFPALRRALTPDDHVAILVDETLPDLPQFLTPLLEYLLAAHITPDAVTLLCPQPHNNRAWLDRLPPDFLHVKVEDHDPHNRKKLSYLATTKQGRRVYLNRTAIDADQLVVLSRRGYDPLLGRGGAEGAIYPALSDGEARTASLGKLSMTAPGASAWPMYQEAAEITWLMGAPFFVQVIAGAGEETTHVLAGPAASSAEGRRLLDARWRVEVDEPADVVIAEVGAEAQRQTFADLAAALACASRVVKPGGRIVVLSDAWPDLGDAGQLLRQANTPDAALALLRERHPADAAAAFQWAQAARRAQLYLVSRLPVETVEESFAAPLEHAGQVEHLLGAGRCLCLPDAEKTLAVVNPTPIPRDPGGTRTTSAG